MSVSLPHSATRLAIGLLAIFFVVLAGCSTASPPPRIAVPDQSRGNPNATYEHATPKPMPSDQPMSDVPAPPFNDEPLVNQRPPEEHAFIQSYNRIGRPHLAILVNPLFRNGAEDELASRSIDYAAMEAVLEEWFSCEGQVTLISPDAAAQRLTEQQMKDLQSGDPNIAKQVAEKIAADVIVQVQVEPIRQAGQTSARMVAKAVNVRGGQSIARSDRRPAAAGSGADHSKHAFCRAENHGRNDRDVERRSGRPAPALAAAPCARSHHQRRRRFQRQFLRRLRRHRMS